MIFDVKLNIPPEILRSDAIPRFIDFTVDGINNAAFVYSPTGMYPYNLNDNIPTLRELQDKQLRGNLSKLDAFIELVGINLTSTAEAPRENQLQLR